MKHNEPLTLAAARAHFRAYWLPTLRSNDRASVRLAWSQYIDALHRERRISDKQAHTWDIPANFGMPRKVARKNPSACGCRSNPSKARRTACSTIGAKMIRCTGTRQIPATCRDFPTHRGSNPFGCSHGTRMFRTSR